MRNRTSPDLQARIIAAYDRGQHSTPALAERFEVSQPTVWRLIDKHKKGQDIRHKPRAGGRCSKLDKKDIGLVKKTISKCPTLTRQEVADAVANGSGKKVSRWTIGRLFAKLGMTNKKVSSKAEESTSVRVKKKRKKFVAEQSKLDIEKLVFLDETGVNRLMGRERAWGPANLRVTGIRPINRRESTTVIGAIRQTGLVAMRSKRGGMKKVDFIGFIKKVLSPCLRRGDVLVMDNLQVHRAEKVRHILSQRGIRILFLPPYSPDMNPIERTWSSLKTRFRRRFRRMAQTVSRAVGGAWRSLKSLEMTPMIRAAGYC